MLILRRLIKRTLRLIFQLVNNHTVQLLEYLVPLQLLNIAAKNDEGDTLQRVAPVDVEFMRVLEELLLRLPERHLLVPSVMQ